MKRREEERTGEVSFGGWQSKRFLSPVQSSFPFSASDDKLFSTLLAHFSSFPSSHPLCLCLHLHFLSAFGGSSAAFLPRPPFPLAAWFPIRLAVGKTPSWFFLEELRKVGFFFVLFHPPHPRLFGFLELLGVRRYGRNQA